MGEQVPHLAEVIHPFRGVIISVAIGFGALDHCLQPSPSGLRIQVPERCLDSLVGDKDGNLHEVKVIPGMDEQAAGRAQQLTGPDDDAGFR